MRKEYDFSKAKKNRYAKRLEQSVTMRLDKATVDYFKGLADELEVPYQTLINHHLRDRALSRRKPSRQWRPSRRGAA
jgi:predicted DNA binding CopG/RHH family protein